MKVLDWCASGWMCRKMAGFMLVSLLWAMATDAQDGNAGINQANTLVRSYFAAGENLMYAIGAILG